jgi:hypothetical protein
MVPDDRKPRPFIHKPPRSASLQILPSLLLDLFPTLSSRFLFISDSDVNSLVMVKVQTPV